MSPILEILKNYGASDVKSALLSDLAESHARIFAIGEIYHFAASGLRNTVRSILPELVRSGYRHVAIELSEQFSAEARQFLDTGQLTDLASAVCSPRFGNRSMYCKNRFLLDGAGDELDFADDYADLLRSIRDCGLEIHCIDAKRGAEVDRDEYMADAIKGILSGVEKLVWIGGAKHMMSPSKLGKSAAERVGAIPSFRLTGLELPGEMPEWVNPTMDTTDLGKTLSKLNNQVYIRSSVPALSLLTAYCDLNPHESVKFEAWDGVIFYPLQP